jgi:hypothetical protein
MAQLVRLSDQIGNHHGQSVMQAFFYTVSAFCFFCIQPILWITDAKLHQAKYKVMVYVKSNKLLNNNN